MTVARNHSHTCARAAFTSPQLLFESGVYFVQELRIVWLLFKDGVYSKKYGICECTNYLSSPLTNGIGGGLLALLVHAVVSGDCSMCCLTLHCSPIRTYQHTRHHPKTAIACKQRGGRRKCGPFIPLGVYATKALTNA